MTSDEENSESPILLVQRPPDGLLASLWEVPTVIIEEKAGKSREKKAKKQRITNNARDEMEETKEVKPMVHSENIKKLSEYVESLGLSILANELVSAQFSEEQRDSGIEFDSLIQYHGTVHHLFTHISYTAHVYSMTKLGKEYFDPNKLNERVGEKRKAIIPNLTTARPSGLKILGIPTLTRKIIKKALKI